MAWDIEVVGGVAVVTMNSNKINAQDDGFFQDLHEALDRVEANHPRLSMVLTARGATFSAGLDFRQIVPLFLSDDQDEISAWWQRYRATNMRLFRLARPTVAAVNGHAIAGGFITAATCDFRVGVSEARYGLNEVRVGIPMPLEYLEIVRYTTGSAATNILALGGDLYDGEYMHKIGFLNDLTNQAHLVERAVSLLSWMSVDTFDAYVASKAATHAPVEHAIKQLASETAQLSGQALLTSSSAAARSSHRERLRSRGASPKLRPER